MAGLVWQPSELLAASLLETHRDAFKAALAAGTRRNFIFPYDFIPSFLVPVLYMSIPHTNRPWLYAARWLVLAFAVVFNLDMMTRASSTNIAWSYAAGMWGLWAIMQNLVLLAWTRPQFEAERVQRRKRHPIMGSTELAGGASSGPGTLHNGGAMTHRRGYQDVQKGVNGHAEINEHSQLNGQAKISKPITDGTRDSSSKNHEAALAAPGADLAKYEYYWQAFPQHGSFLERLFWALDLYSTFRASGWNWVVRVIPHPQPPKTPRSGELVDMTTVPLRTPSGYRTYTTQAAFLRSKIGGSLIAYLSLDFLKIIMMRDPYFAYGSTSTAALPPHLANLSPWLLSLYRHALFLWALYVVLLWFFSSISLASYYLLGPLFPMRGELWQHSSIFGSFDQILDRGLAGFWGVWWHQTFRIPFAGPSAYLLRHGYLPPRTLQAKAAGMLFAFFQSGLLHGCGSFSSIPDTKVWYPMLFFMLSGAGIIVQSAACVALKEHIDRVPRPLRRAGNLCYVLLWLHLTVWPLLEDFTRLGVWLLEPVPFSLLRALGFGQTENGWYRIENDALPHWTWGANWRQIGFAL